MEDVVKKVVIAIDGSKDSLKALDYMELIFGVDHPLDVVLFHVLPALPPILIDDNDPQDRKMRAKLRTREKEHRQAAEKILEQGKRLLMEKGFKEERIATEYQRKARDIARDTCEWSERRLADAAVIARGERVALGDFFSAGVSSNLVDHCRVAPVWIVSGQIRSRKVLLCVESRDLLTVDKKLWVHLWLRSNMKNSCFAQSNTEKIPFAPSLDYLDKSLETIF